MIAAGESQTVSTASFRPHGVDCRLQQLGHAGDRQHLVEQLVERRHDKLDNTLIIYIAGDNGNSAEGTTIGTPNEVASFNGIDVPVEDQLRYFYDAWGS